MIAKYKAGDRVWLKHRRDQIGVITGTPEIIGGEYWYEIFFTGQYSPRHPESRLELCEGENNDITSLLLNNSFSTKQTMSRIVTITKLDKPLRNNIYALYSSRTHFLPYQYKPVFKFLDALDSSRARMLIADEVGLGKTIEAGLVYLEEKARYSVNRVVVVCPKALCHKWRLELLNKFGEEFEVFTSKETRAFLKEIQERGDAPRKKAIISLESLRTKQILQEWEAVSPHIDIVIVDEAHHMRNSDTSSHKVGRVLSDNSDTMLLLTATPIHLQSNDLFNLLRVLDEDQFNNSYLFFENLKANRFILKALQILREKFPPDFPLCKDTLRNVEYSAEPKRFLSNPIYKDVLFRLDNPDPSSREFTVELQRDITSLNVLSHIVTRTQKREVVENRIFRRARVVQVDNFSEEEFNFYNAVKDYVIAHYDKKGMGNFGAFISIMPLRQAASCIPAMRERYLANLGASIEDADVFEEEDDALEGENFSDFEQEERKAIRVLIEASRSVEGKDSKFDHLVEILKTIPPKDKVLIFSYFKMTLGYLQKRLNVLGYTTAIISGDFKDEQRQETMELFRQDPNLQILLSSEVGSEGLDFEFCHVMVNYDLPWNPMKVEQRIGRLDRIGQKSDAITIINLTIPGTIEDKILRRLYMRIGIFKESIGDLENILGDEIKRLSIELISRDLSPEEQDKRIEQTAEVICRRKKDWQEMENKSSEFIGHDQFFLDEMDRVQKNKRYISSEELVSLINDFFETNFPKSSLKKLKEPELWALRMNDPLINYIREKVNMDDSHITAFLNAFYAAKDGGIKVTFDPEKALKDRGLQFINIYHPLISAIKSHYLDNPGELHPVSKVKLCTNVTREGEYLYFIQLINIQCARSRNIQEAIFIPFNGTYGEVSNEESELLLSEMVSNGLTYEEFKGYDREVMKPLIERANKMLELRIRKRKEEAERINESLISDKIVSLDRSFEIKVQKQKDRLKKRDDKEYDIRYVRMVEGSIRNLELDHEQRRNQLEKERIVDVSYITKGAGVLRVLRNG